jgi:hypothetical protein
MTLPPNRLNNVGNCVGQSEFFGKVLGTRHSNQLGIT